MDMIYINILKHLIWIREIIIIRSESVEPQVRSTKAKIFIEKPEIQFLKILRDKFGSCYYIVMFLF